MSLVNDMLRDLASRREPVPVGDTRQLLDESGWARTTKPLWLPSIIAFVITLTLLWLVQHLFFNATPVSPAEASGVNAPSNQQEQQSAQVTRVVPELVPEREADVAEAPAINVAVSTSAEAQSEASTAEDTNNQLHQPVVDAWLKLAQTAVAQDRLTSPLEQSAYYFYLQVLALVPDHPHAVSGLETIVERYLTLARAAQAQQQFERAQILLQRAQVVRPDSLAIKQYLQQLAESSADNQHDPVMQVSTGLDERAEVTPVAEENLATSAAPAASVPVASASVNSYPGPTDVTSASVWQVTPNREWQDQQATQQALDWQQQGQVARAQQHLEEFIAAGAAPQASQLLYQLYVEQRDVSAAATLLAQADQHRWSITDRARLQAQALLAQEDPAGAVAILEQHLADAQQDERYRVLLANVYRTTGRHHEAAASYRRLLESFGETGSYWLGLALSLDALGQKHSALEAFQRARNFQPLQAEVNHYIEQRIAALRR